MEMYHFEFVNEFSLANCAFFLRKKGRGGELELFSLSWSWISIVLFMRILEDLFLDCFQMGRSYLRLLMHVLRLILHRWILQRVNIRYQRHFITISLLRSILML